MPTRAEAKQDRVVKYVTENPGCSLNDIAEGICRKVNPQQFQRTTFIAYGAAKQAVRDGRLALAGERVFIPESAQHVDALFGA